MCLILRVRTVTSTTPRSVGRHYLTSVYMQFLVRFQPRIHPISYDLHF